MVRRDVLGRLSIPNVPTNVRFGVPASCGLATTLFEQRHHRSLAVAVQGKERVSAREGWVGGMSRSFDHRDLTTTASTKVLT